jgi:L-lactate dehydrogenase complex protein LldE
METEKPVSLFIQCLIDALYPEVGEAVVRIFERLGIPVTYPQGQTCCGQPAYNAGYLDEARSAARHFLEVFADAPCIVAPSGSCVHMVRHHYRHLLADDPVWFERARRVAVRTYELTEYLVDVIGVTDLGVRLEGSVTYHESCHLLRGLGISDQPRALLKNIVGLRLVEMKNADTCCGFGGTFAFKYPVISAAMVEDKVRHILETGADTITGCDMGCLMNIEGALSRRGHAVRVRHIAQLLAADAGDATHG